MKNFVPGDLRFRKPLTLLVLAVSSPIISASVAEPLFLEVTSAKVSRDLRTGRPIAIVTFTDASRQALHNFSNSNLAHKVEFRVDGEVLTKVIIRDPLISGVVHINLDKLTAEKIDDLAARLSKAGANVEIQSASD